MKAVQAFNSVYSRLLTTILHYKQTKCSPDKTISLTAYLMDIGLDRPIQFSIHKVCHKSNNQVCETLNALSRNISNQRATTTSSNKSPKATESLTWTRNTFCLKKDLLLSFRCWFIKRLYRMHPALSLDEGIKFWTISMSGFVHLSSAVYGRKYLKKIHVNLEFDSMTHDES